MTLKNVRNFVFTVGIIVLIIAVNMLFQILNVGRIAAEDIKEGQYVYSYVWVALVVLSVFWVVSYLRQERRKAGGHA